MRFFAQFYICHLTMKDLSPHHSNVIVKDWVPCNLFDHIDAFCYRVPANTIRSAIVLCAPELQLLSLPQGLAPLVVLLIQELFVISSL